MLVKPIAADGGITRIQLERCRVLRQPWAQRVVRGEFPLLLQREPIRFRNFVGILSARRVARDEGPLDDIAYPRGAIVGAIEVSKCLMIDSQGEQFLQSHFGPEIAATYPSRYIPRQSPTFVWLISRTLTATNARQWDGRAAIRWARSEMELEGRVMRFLHHPLMDLRDGEGIPTKKAA